MFSKLKKGRTDSAVVSSNMEIQRPTPGLIRLSCMTDNTSAKTNNLEIPNQAQRSNAIASLTIVT